MALFGRGRLPGLLVDPRTEEEKQAEYESILRMADPFATKQRRAMQRAVGNEVPKQPSFWQGGDKFTGKDALAGLLSAIGDIADMQAGRDASGIDSLAQFRLSAVEQAKAQAQQQAIRDRLIASGVSPADADILSNDKTAVREQIGRRYEPQKPPAMQQNYDWWKSLTPEEQRRFSEYQSVVNPRWMTGPDDRPYQMPPAQPPGALPPGFDPNEWEVVPQGGGVGNGTGNFRPRYR